MGSSGIPVSGKTAAANEIVPEAAGGIGKNTIASLVSPEGSCQDASACYQDVNSLLLRCVSTNHIPSSFLGA